LELFRLGNPHIIIGHSGQVVLHIDWCFCYLDTSKTTYSMLYSWYCQRFNHHWSPRL